MIKINIKNYFFNVEEIKILIFSCYILYFNIKIISLIIIYYK